MRKKHEETKTSDDMNLLLNNIIQYGPKIVQNRPLLKMAMAMGENYLIKDGKNRLKNDPSISAGVVEDQTAMSLAILNSVNRALSDCKFSEATYQKAGAVLGRDLFIEKSKRKEKAASFTQKYGISQPSFLLISPTKACNLHCIGCYADSDSNVQSLDWEIVDKTITNRRFISTKIVIAVIFAVNSKTISTSSHILSNPIEYLKGVGPQRADLLKKEFFFMDDLKNGKFLV